jgi:hypothetical protein
MKSKTQKWQDIVDEFRGRGTIKALRVEKRDDGKFRLHYKDNGKPLHVDWDTRQELDQALFEFGGKNDFTVRALDEFLKLNGWDSETLSRLGHECTKICLHGLKRIRSQRIPISVPEDCGYPDIIDKHTKQKQDIIYIKQADEEVVDLTRTFKDVESLDRFIHFIMQNEFFQGFDWSVRVLNTYSKDDDRHCVWKRTKAGDGTSRMVLELQKLDGKHYSECLPYDIVSAGDGLIGGECRKIAVIKKAQQEQLLCELHAIENLNPDEYECVAASTTQH